MSLLVFAGVALLSLLATEAWRRWALRRGVMDHPGVRSSHGQPTPRGGGVGLVVAFAVGAAWLWPADEVRAAVLMSVIAAALVGLWDDLRPLTPLRKLSGQALAALPMAWALPFSVAVWANVPALPPLLATAVSWALAMFLLNAWNFMDGINGIAASAAMTVCAVALITLGGQDGGMWATAVLCAAACLGFLPLNFPKARVFMGDCGSHALGMIMAALLLWPSSVMVSAVVLVAISPFVIDVLGTLVRRALDHERLTQAHRRHLYQLVTRSGYSHAWVTLCYVVWIGGSGLVVMGGSMALAEPAFLAALILAVNAAIWWWASQYFERRLREEGRW